MVEAREKWVAELERGAGEGAGGLSASAAATSGSVLGPLTAPLPVSSSAPRPLDVWTSVQPQPCCPSTSRPSSWTSGLRQTDRFPVFSGQTDISTSKEEMRVF